MLNLPPPRRQPIAPLVALFRPTSWHPPLGTQKKKFENDSNCGGSRTVLLPFTRRKIRNRIRYVFTHICVFGGQIRPWLIRLQHIKIMSDNLFLLTSLGAFQYAGLGSTGRTGLVQNRYDEIKRGRVKW